MQAAGTDLDTTNSQVSTSLGTQEVRDLPLLDRTDPVAFLINEVLTDYIQRRDNGIAKAIFLGDQVLRSWIDTKRNLEKNLA